MGNSISESDTRANFIDPKLADSQWEPIHIVREYYFTDGRKLLENKRGKRLFLDYLLKSNNTNLAIIEAKKFFDYQNGINSIVTTQTQKLTNLKSLKSSLLDRAFRGEL